MLGRFYLAYLARLSAQSDTPDPIAVEYLAKLYPKPKKNKDLEPDNLLQDLAEELQDDGEDARDDDNGEDAQEEEREAFVTEVAEPLLAEMYSL